MIILLVSISFTVYFISVGMIGAAIGAGIVSAVTILFMVLTW